MNKYERVLAEKKARAKRLEIERLGYRSHRGCELFSGHCEWCHSRLVRKNPRARGGRNYE